MSDTDQPNQHILQDLAERIVAGDFVPFIGSGCSRVLLGGFDWAGISAATAEALGTEPTGSPTEIAQRYETRFGRDALVSFLRERLTVASFDDVAGTAQIALMEMRFPIYYSTNVDNVTEACYAKYGHRLSVVAKPEDLREIKIGQPRLMKFHGDVSAPGSLVWTEHDYTRRRLDHDNFMHIVLRADLLVHSLMFVGYSLSPDDLHVRQLLEEMQREYPQAMRDSVFISYGSSSAIDLSDLGIRVISTSALYPDLDADTAFSQTMVDLGREVKRAEVGLEISNIFTSSSPKSAMVLSDYDLRNTEAAIADVSVEQGVNLFRSACDGVRIPSDLEGRVVSLFVSLCMRAQSAEEARALSYIPFNLNLADAKHWYVVYCEVYALHWLDDGFFSVVKGKMDEPRQRALLIAGAAMLLEERGHPRSLLFANWVSRNAHFGSEVLSTLDNDLREPISHVFQNIFDGSPGSSPLDRPYTSRLPTMTYDEMLSRMTGSLPRTTRRPY